MKPTVRTEILECLVFGNMCPIDRTWALGIDIPDFCEWEEGKYCPPEKVKACWDKWITAFEEGDQ